MDITTGKPYAISEKGGRLKNEDAIYPQPESGNISQKLYIVCDGVGGAEKGEVASALACDSLQTYFSTFLEGEPSEEFINKAIRYTETRFDNYIESHPEAKGMATTLTLLYIGNTGITLAHVGDSRIYQFRKGEIIYQTEDHSLVNSLLKLGKITSKEASTHPQKNVIIRAIQGSEYPTEADVVLINDVQPNDCFFMCTDGVLENFDNQAISEIFSKTFRPEDIKDKIMDKCIGRTRDNFSFYIIPIQNVLDSTGFKQFILSFLYSFI